MKALLIENPGQVGFGTVTVPEPRPDEILLRVGVVGFCGSDLNTFRGLNPLVSYPRIPGHEIAAVVESVGAQVPADLFQVGAGVTVLPYTACGECPACRRGRVNTCRSNQTLGVQRDGSLTRWIAVPWEKVVPTGRLSPHEAALVEPLSVGFHAVDRAAVAREDRVVVIGCGAVGLGAVAGAARRQATVIAVDVDDRKLELARRAGAQHLVNSRHTPLHPRLQELTAGDGPDVVIEAVGLPETFVAAVSEVSFAGRVVYIGYSKAPVSYDTAQFVKKELDIRGSRNATRGDFEAVIEMLGSAAFPVDDAVTRVVPFAEAGDALHAWDADPSSVTRIHVKLD